MTRPTLHQMLKGDLLLEKKKDKSVHNFDYQTERQGRKLQYHSRTGY